MIDEKQVKQFEAIRSFLQKTIADRELTLADCAIGEQQVEEIGALIYDLKADIYIKELSEKRAAQEKLHKKLKTYQLAIDSCSFYIWCVAVLFFASFVLRLFQLPVDLSLSIMFSLLGVQYLQTRLEKYKPKQ